MAKMLDALARAQRERLQQQQPAPPPANQATGFLAGTAAQSPSAEGDVPSASLMTATPAFPGVHPLVSDLVVGAHDNFSAITEQVRQIRTNLEAVLADHASRPIVVTSPISGDGKTLVAANLAWVLADNLEQRVLLVDADMRKPDQDRLYGIRRVPGLSEYLREQCPIEQAIHPTSMPNLSVMPAGRDPGKPTALLSGHRLPELVDQLKQRFSWIVFDTPPLLPVTDAALIARHCAGLLLVVRMGRTHRKVIERAQELLAEMRLPILGCVLNEFAPQAAADEYDSGYYAHGRHGEDDK